MKRQKFQDLPITSKLRGLQAISVGLALLFTLLFNGVTQLWREHGDDSKSATDILSALRGKPGIVAAQIYTPRRERVCPQ